MTKLSVNINKIATLRNSRGGNVPDLLQVATDIQEFGAEGITIHPRPDERHIRYQDARDLKKIVHTEYNIEGNPIPKFIDLVLEVKPTQVTLVPDAEDAITSNAGWDTLTHAAYLTEIVAEFKRHGIRTSLFVDPVEKIVETQMMLQAVREAISELNDEEREIIFRLFYEEESLRSIAKDKEISAPALLKRRNKIFEKLKKLLKDII